MERITIPAVSNLSGLPNVAFSSPEGISISHMTISAVLSLLGWEDKRPAIMQADEEERILVKRLQMSYTQYGAFPTLASFAELKASLTVVIDKLEKNRVTAMQLAKDAEARLSQVNSTAFGFISQLVTVFKTTFGSDDRSLVEHYIQLAATHAASQQQLSQLLNNLQIPLGDAAGISAPATHQRRLLQTPNVTTFGSPFCFPAGVCDLRLLSDGYLGFTLQGELLSGSGSSVSSGGDINGDEFPDMLIGASGNIGVAGQVYVVFGSQNNTDWRPGIIDLSTLIDGRRGFVLQGEAACDWTGNSISSAGDMNGDGLSDILIGAYGNGGQVYVVFGSRNITAWGLGRVDLSTLMDGQRGFVLRGAPGSLGVSVSGVGDINGDNLSDILLGTLSSGRSYVVFGSRLSNAWGNGILNLTNLTDGQRGFILEGEVPGDGSGNSVGSAGDFNSDGFADMLIGAPAAASSAGKTYVVFGSRNGWSSGLLNLNSIINGQRGFVLQGEYSQELSGGSVGAGDINGDGLPDILIGASGVNIGFAGRTYVVFGSKNATAWSAGLLALRDLRDGQRGFVLQGSAGDRSGKSVSSAGDINGDGAADILIGAVEAAPSGKTYVVFGSNLPAAWGSGVLNLSNLTDGIRGFLLPGETGDQIGISVGSAGDINRDGLADIIVGASANIGGRPAAGKSYIVFGGHSLPLYFTANYLQLAAGETITLSADNLAVGSTRSDINLTALLVTVKKAVNGYFALRSAPSKSINDFYMQDINDRLVRFVHTGGALAPQYQLAVNLPSPLNILVSSISSQAEIDFLGYRPNLINNKLLVNQGGSTVVEAGDMSASDQDNSPADLSFIVSNLTHGEFRVYNATTNTSLATTEFSQKAVLDRVIQFVHDNSRNKPAYWVKVYDTKSFTETQAASITFNYAPAMNITTGVITLDQGQPTTLNPENISASDNETFKESLIIEVTNITSGYFAYVGNTHLPITAFQQLSLTTGAVQFVQNGSAVTPGFALRAFDGTLYSSWQSPRLYLNQRPVRHGSMADQTVTQDQAFRFTLPSNLFNDSNSDPLSYVARLQGGAPLPKEIQFISPDRFQGNVPTVSNFPIEVEASDPRNLTATTSFSLISRAPVPPPAGIDYKALYTTFSSVGGVTLTVLAYLWVRRRITKHRRDFLFANALRNTLNLEYYDFTRFDGDTYKTKTENFLLGLQLQHQNFYLQLTPEEQASFAVCVAEIVTKRRLVSRSNYMGGLFGLLCCLNVGWPLQLDLKAFEVQSVSIAAEAVAAWKQAAAAEKEDQKPLTRWPYYAPAWKERLKVFFCFDKPLNASRWRAISNASVTSGIALEELKKHEGTSYHLAMETVAEQKTSNELASKISFLEEESKLVKEQVRIIREENNSMAVTIKTLLASS